jgi:hypothetical protein
MLFVRRSGYPYPDDNMLHIQTNILSHPNVYVGVKTPRPTQDLSNPYTTTYYLFTPTYKKSHILKTQSSKLTPKNLP